LPFVLSTRGSSKKTSPSKVDGMLGAFSIQNVSQCNYLDSKVAWRAKDIALKHSTTLRTKG
jgi:hypothetical protein